MDREEYLLAELRCAFLRAKLMAADITAVGIAVKSRVITAEQALMILRDCGLLSLLSPQVVAMLKGVERERGDDPRISLTDSLTN